MVAQSCSVSLQDVVESLSSVEDMLNELSNKEAKSDELDTSKLKSELKDYIDAKISTNTRRNWNAEIILRGLVIEKKLRRQTDERVALLNEALMEKVKQIESLQDKVDALEKAVMTKSAHITDLEMNDDQMKKVVFGFMEDITQKVDVSQKAFENSINDMNETFAAAIAKAKREIGDIMSPSLNLPKTGNMKIAFHARIGYGNSYQDIDPWQTLVFSDELLNIGDGYSSSTGEFVAPVKGVYVFHVHITGGDNKALEICLLKNHSYMLLLYVRGPGHGTDSGSAPLALDEGDVVKVIKHGPWGQRPFYVHNSYSSFSGFLLFEQ